MRNPGYISKAERIARHAAARDEASGRLAGDTRPTCTCGHTDLQHGRLSFPYPCNACLCSGWQEAPPLPPLETNTRFGAPAEEMTENSMDRAERAEEEQVAEHRAWIAEKSEKGLDNVMSPDVSSLLSPETPITKEKETMATLTQKRTTRDGRHVLYEIQGVGAVRFARGMFPKDITQEDGTVIAVPPPASMEIGGVFVEAKAVKAVDPVKAAARAAAKANALENAQRLAAKHAARAAKAKARYDKILAKQGAVLAPAVEQPAVEQPAVEQPAVEQPAA